MSHLKTVNFSHGDIEAFPPLPQALDEFAAGLGQESHLAFTESRGDVAIRRRLAGRLELFTGAPVDAEDGLMLTPGTQGALYLAVSSTVSAGDKVAVVRPDYFFIEKIVQWRGAEVVPIGLSFLDGLGAGGLDLDRVEAAFRGGAKVFVFSNPNNPTGYVLSPQEVQEVGHLAEQHGVVLIVDQLYSRLVYSGTTYTHLRATDLDPERVITVMGPSKTESLAGYRLGAAFGSSRVISRMGALQSLVCLRAAGYNQAALRTWFAEPEGWLHERIAGHETVRNAVVSELRKALGLAVRAPEAGGFMFPRLPPLSVEYAEFIAVLRDTAGVVVTPGAVFAGDWDRYIRLNCSQDCASALQAIERMVGLTAKLAR